MSTNQNLGQRIGQNVRMLRKEKKMTQEQLSEKSNLAINTVRNIEKGRWPSEHSMSAIADALGVEAKILLGAVNDEVYLREEVKTQLKTAVEKILENPSYTLGHVDYRRKE